MNVPTITMDPKLAAEKLKAFRADKHKDAEAIYAETATAYAALAEGTPIINLSAAIQAGGYFADMSPKLAIARSDRREVRFRWEPNSEAIEFDCRNGQERALNLVRNVNVQRTHGVPFFRGDGKQDGFKWLHGYTLVPMVPADVRPKTGQLKDWFTLFEVDQWYKLPKHMKAPVDPLLLKHLGGELYAVLAQWDLTDVERMILEGVNRR